MNLPTENDNCRKASMNGIDSMSPEKGDNSVNPLADKLLLLLFFKITRVIKTSVVYIYIYLQIVYPQSLPVQSHKHLPAHPFHQLEWQQLIVSNP